MKQLLFIFLINISFVLKANSETELPPDQKLQIINYYVNFINESIHGLLVADKLFETYNVDINKYVDIESHKTNQYSNKDLTEDIFKDNSFFIDKTPFDWYKLAKAESIKSGNGGFVSLQQNADKLLVTITAINNLRFELDKAIIGVDLKNKDNLNKVYHLLEKGVILNQDFYKNQIAMEKTIANLTIPNRAERQKEDNATTLSNAILELYRTTKLLVTKMRERDANEIKAAQTKQSASILAFTQANLSSLKNEAQKPLVTAAQIEDITASAKALNEAANNLLNNVEIPEVYKLYGKFHYYYNVVATAKFNYYGSAMVRKMNTIVESNNLPLPKMMETPHYLQIIYPKKVEALDVVKAQEGFISAMPTKLKERTIQMKNKIRADNDIFEIFLYDNMIEDGEIVSINFNGDFILENYKVVREPKRIALKLNNEGKNYLILHAVNVGKRPPATMAFSYNYNGEKKEYVLKSDLNTSELIEIILTK